MLALRVFDYRMHSEAVCVVVMFGSGHFRGLSEVTAGMLAMAGVCYVMGTSDAGHFRRLAMITAGRLAVVAMRISLAFVVSEIIFLMSASNAGHFRKLTMITAG